MKSNLAIFSAGVLGMVASTLSEASLLLVGASRWCLKKQGEILHAEFTREPETAQTQ